MNGNRITIWKNTAHNKKCETIKILEKNMIIFNLGVY